MALLDNGDPARRYLPVPIHSLLAEREEGNLRGLALERAVKRMRSELLGLSRDREIKSFEGSSVTCMCVDEVEDRYLLCGYRDGSVSIVDCEDIPRSGRHAYETVQRLERQRAHRYTITGCAWYPMDTGLYMTGSFDETLKVWDANREANAHTFALPAKVHCIAMSASARHSHVAAGCGDGTVYLCDLRSGSHHHSLRGHRGSWVSAAAWRPGDEFALVTGGKDGTLRLWDVRRTKSCLALLCQEGRPKHPKRGRGDEDDLSPPIAHSGGVDAAVFTPEGRYLLSSGADCRVREWDPDTCELVVVNFGTFPRQQGGRGQVHRVLQPACAGNAPIFYHPRAKEVLGCNVETGERVLTLRAHLDAVTCVCAQARGEQVFTAGLDNNLLVWQPPRTWHDEGGGGGGEGDGGGDAWSDDER